MDQHRLIYLLNQRNSPGFTNEEKEELRVLLEKEDIASLVLQEISNTVPDETVDIERWQPVLNRVMSVDRGFNRLSFAHKTEQLVHLIKTNWLRYAAAVILVVGVAFYYFSTRHQTDEPAVARELNKEPGTDKAILILSDGRQVTLDNTGKKSFADGSVSIEKSEGVLSYNSALPSSKDPAKETFNTMITPRGGQYQLLLPDGSKVWLNSASSLRYPTIFNGKNRVVELSGEAYFDIKENRNMPFVVKTQKAEVLVLGTGFNINSYTDEPLFSTTLINGSVKVIAGDNARVILPGQQVLLHNAASNSIQVNEDVDVNQVIAWQKGIFKFDGVSVDVIARQLSRWYDVEVRTDIKDNSNVRFNGGINKNTPLKGLLKMLELNGIGNKWENNTITLYSR